MAGNFDKFKVKKPDLNKPVAATAAIIAPPAEAEPDVAENIPGRKSQSVLTKSGDGENDFLAEEAGTPKQPAINSAAFAGDSKQPASVKKSMLQTGYRIREEYIEALRLRAKREERKIESVLDEILSDYFDRDATGQKYLQTAHQILQIKLDY